MQGVDTLREMTRSLEIFRDNVGRRWYTKEKGPACPWRATLPPSTDSLLSFLEDAVFHKVYDEALLSWLHARKPIAELLDVKTIRDTLDEIQEALETEGKSGGEKAEGDQQMCQQEDEEGMLGMDGDATLQAVRSELQSSDDPQDQEDFQKLERYMSAAINKVKVCVELAPETLTDPELSEALAKSAAGSCRPDAAKKEHVLIWYSAAECGEATAQPHLRVPALRARGDHFLRVFRTCQMRYENATGELPDRDIYAVCDAGKEGNKGLLLGKFIFPNVETDPKMVPKHVRTLAATFEEPSIVERFELARGFSSVNQLMKVHLVTAGPLDINQHSRLHTAKATNRGNLLGPFQMDSWEDQSLTWKLPVKSKLAFFGKHGARIPVGGSAESKEEDEDKDKAETFDWEKLDTNPKFKTRDRNDTEPFLFHSCPRALLEELIHGHDIVACIGMAADGKLAEACLERRIPFFGFGFTQEHCDGLIARLERRAFNLMQDDKSKLFVPGLKVLMNKNAVEEEACPAPNAKRASRKRKQPVAGDPVDELHEDNLPEQDVDKKPAPKHSANPKPTPKAKPKAKANPKAAAEPDSIMAEIEALTAAASNES